MKDEWMRDAVGWTWADALEATKMLESSREERPEHFRRATFGEGAKVMSVESEGLILAGGRLNLRYARIQTRLADVATLMMYPTTRPDLVPVFAAEWVVVAERVHVAVLDVETAGNHPELKASLSPVFLPLFRRFTDRLPPNRELPAWFEEIASDWALFSSLNTDSIPDLRQAFGEYLAATIHECCLPILAEVEPGPDHPAVLEYKHHHALNSPATVLMTPKAGEVWTREFLFSHHFGPSRR